MVRLLAPYTQIKLNCYSRGYATTAMKWQFLNLIECHVIHCNPRSVRSFLTRCRRLVEQLIKYQPSIELCLPIFYPFNCFSIVGSAFCAWGVSETRGVRVIRYNEIESHVNRGKMVNSFYWQNNFLPTFYRKLAIVAQSRVNAST